LEQQHCFPQFISQGQLLSPVLPVATSHWPLQSAIIIGPGLPSAIPLFDSGRSPYSSPGYSQALFDRGWVSVCYGATWESNDASADSDVCDIDVEEASCHFDWDDGDLEGHVCRAFKACVREEKGRPALGEVEKRVEEMGARYSYGWVLPTGWNDFKALKKFYRTSVADRRANFIATDPGCLHAFNLVFLVIGALSCVPTAVSLVLVVQIGTKGGKQ
jgi:hypothetical protein